MRNKKGKIASRTAKFIDAIFLDNKYRTTKTIVFFDKGAFTASANETILKAIRRFVLNQELPIIVRKNFVELCYNQGELWFLEPKVLFPPM